MLITLPTTIKLIDLILTEYPDAIWQESTLIQGDKVEFIQGRLKHYQGILTHRSSEAKVAFKVPGLKQVLIINVPVSLMKNIT